MVNPLKNNRTPKFSKPPQQGRAATTTSDYEHANVKYLKELVVGNITAKQLSGANLVNVSGAGAGQWDRTGNNIFPKDLTYNVGINTQNPQGKLDVNGDTITIELHVDQVATINNLTITGSLNMSGANIVTNGEWISGDGDDEGIFIDNSGNVGINTSNPTSSFAVQGESNFNGETNINDVSFINAASTFNDTAQFNSGIVSWGGATFNTQIETNSGINMAGSNVSLNDGWLSNDGDNEGIRIFDDGHIGIGTGTRVNPLFGSRQVTIGGDTVITVDMNQTSASYGMQDTNDNANYYFYGAGIHNDAKEGTVLGGYFNMGTDNHAGRFDMRFAGNETFYFYEDGTLLQNGSGNVGIGYTPSNLPSAKLDVAGDIKTSDFLEIEESSAPSAPSSGGRVFVDSADGDLKVIFSNGTTQTLASN